MKLVELHNFSRSHCNCVTGRGNFIAMTLFRCFQGVQYPVSTNNHPGNSLYDSNNLLFFLSVCKSKAIYSLKLTFFNHLISFCF